MQWILLQTSKLFPKKVYLEIYTHTPLINCPYMHFLLEESTEMI